MKLKSGTLVLSNKIGPGWLHIILEDIELLQPEDSYYEQNVIKTFKMFDVDRQRIYDEYLARAWRIIVKNKTVEVIEFE